MGGWVVWNGPTTRIFLRRIAIYFIALIAFSLPALLNGYPFVFSDSGTYLRSAIELKFPSGRPVFYSIFIYFLHWKISTWPIVFAQAIICVFIIERIFDTLGGAKASLHTLNAIIGLALFTSFPWFVGQIVPDLFAPLIVVATYTLLVHYDIFSLKMNLMLCFLLCIFQSSHYSHILLAAGTIATLILFSQLYGHKLKIQAVALGMSTLVISIAAIFLVNYIALGRLVFSPNQSMFLLARLVEYGTAQDYLARNCQIEPYKICAVRDQLPTRFADFLFDHSGILKAIGPIPGDESTLLVKRVLQDAPLRHAVLAWDATLTQFMNFPTGWGLRPYPPESQIHRMIHSYFGREADQFDRSLQQNDNLRLDMVNLIHVPIGYLLIILNFFLLVFSLYKRRNYEALLLSTILTVLLINAFLCGALSSSDGRYQSRMIPLLFLGAYVTINRLWAPLTKRDNSAHS